jgi:hypothetical protein
MPSDEFRCNQKAAQGAGFPAGSIGDCGLVMMILLGKRPAADD